MPCSAARRVGFFFERPRSLPLGGLGTPVRLIETCLREKLAAHSRAPPGPKSVARSALAARAVSRPAAPPDALDRRLEGLSSA